MRGNNTYETERLILRSTDENDSSFILELINTPKWIKFIGDRKVYTLESAKDYIRTKMYPQLDRLGYSNYTIIRKSDHKKMGTCGLYDREGLEGIDLGFAFLPEFERKGYAFEAASKIMDAAFNEFGIDEIKAITNNDNLSSQNLLKKLGFILFGTTQLPDDEKDLLLFKLSKPKT